MQYYTCTRPQDPSHSDVNSVHSIHVSFFNWKLQPLIVHALCTSDQSPSFSGITPVLVLVHIDGTEGFLFCCKRWTFIVVCDFMVRDGGNEYPVTPVFSFGKTETKLSLYFCNTLIQ
jgi:hypothetical protein